MNLFGMGSWEIGLILIVALIIFGPGKLPEVAGQVGKAVRDFRRITSDLTGEFERQTGVKDIKKTLEQEITGVKNEVSGVGKSIEQNLNLVGRETGHDCREIKYIDIFNGILDTQTQDCGRDKEGSTRRSHEL